jgi:hypothetical protein
MILFLALPMTIFLLPTAILRIGFYFFAEFFNKLSEYVGILDDFLHSLWEKPFYSAVKWSKKPLDKS